jgi:hypothetical protein
LKKIVPNLIRINSDFTPSEAEDLFLWRCNRTISKGYSFSIVDFNCYCGLQIKRKGLENLNPKIVNYILKDGEIKREIKYELIRLKILDNHEITKDEQLFFNNERRILVDRRKKIIKKEISRTNINGKILNQINYKNSDYYRELLNLTNQFVDITILDYFIPIVLTYERLVHIFIKHVEETKFGDGQFKTRTFFNYRSSEIWTLIKTIIKIDEENIKEHFIENAVNRDLGKPELMEDYRRNINNPIMIENDKFALTIDKNGFIKMLHQI